MTQFASTQKEVLFKSQTVGWSGPLFESLPEGVATETSGDASMSHDRKNGLVVDVGDTEGDKAKILSTDYGEVNYGQMPEISMTVAGNFQSGSIDINGDLRIGYLRDDGDSERGMYWDVANNEFYVRGADPQPVGIDNARGFILRIYSNYLEDKTTFEFSMDGEAPITAEFDTIDRSGLEALLYWESDGVPTDEITIGYASQVMSL